MPSRKNLKPLSRGYGGGAISTPKVLLYDIEQNNHFVQDLKKILIFEHQDIIRYQDSIFEQNRNQKTILNDGMSHIQSLYNQTSPKNVKCSQWATNLN